MPSFELFAVIALVVFAGWDLIVGVVNDAVNFLNSAIGAKAASRITIMIVASLGMIIGATFSDGIIEVARKGIFTPSFFSTGEVITIFLGVVLADIILLDLYSTFGLPTSTTVSVVFELFGAALIMGFWKFGNFEEAWQVINSASAIKIILGILLSVAVAFVVGLVVQFFTRLLFTFDYKSRLESWGFLWCGVALTALMYYILIEGGKHANFLSASFKSALQTNVWQIALGMFVGFSVLSFLLIKRRVNILKFIILLGTAGLAMSFAGNDLANFIGPSVAGVNAYLGADLAGSLPTPTWVLLGAGIVMSLAMSFSKKARTVTETEVSLGSHNEKDVQRWKPTIFAQKLVVIVTFVHGVVVSILPKKFINWMSKRWVTPKTHGERGESFDLIRASVNLMVSAAIISYATAQKLPLSTTYVTFIVAMATSLADRAWGKDCAANRVTGVFSVVGGWFFTAAMAITMAAIMTSLVFWARGYGLVFAVLIVGTMGYKLFRVHERRLASKA